MKLQRKADSRIPRTRAAIRRAYLELLGQKDVDAITVTDIASAASLDRKTIYNYYASAAAILDELENELVEKVSGVLRDSDFAHWRSDPFGYLDAVTRAFDLNAELSAPLLQKNRRSRVLDKLADTLSERVGEYLRQYILPARRPFARLYADFLTSGVVSVYREWLAHGRAQSLEEIARQVRQLLEAGIASLLVL